MTLQEALGKITDPEVKAFFEQMIANQNSYVTKLETQLKAQPKPATQTGGLDEVTIKYLEKNMREDVISKAKAIILANVSKEYYNAVEADYLKFLDEKMKKENTTVEFATDAFNLVLGRCWSKPDHPIHQVGKTPTPGGTPTPQATPGTNGAQVQGVQDILRQTPPVMSGADPSAGGMPEGGKQVKNTKDAFASFKMRIQGNGSNKFQ